MKRAAMAVVVAVLAGHAFVMAPVRAQSSRGQIAYSSYGAGGTFDVYVMNPDGSFATNLTNSTTRGEVDPSFSSDGTLIAFAGATGDEASDVYVMAADGSSERRVTATPEWEYTPVLSPDGTKVAFVREQRADYDVWISNIDGSSPERITSGVSAGIGALSWRPDGAAIAYSRATDSTGSNQEIYEVTLSDGVQRKVIARAGYDESPQYSPDGSSIAFLGEGAGVNSGLAVFTVNTDGTGLREVDNTGYAFAVAWAPDGTKLLVARGRGRANELLTMDPNGMNPQLVTNEITYDLSWQRCDGDCRLSTVQPSIVFVGPAFVHRRALKVMAEVRPAHTGEPLTITLYKKRDGRFRRVGSQTLAIPASTFAIASFPLQGRGRCKATAVFAGDEDHQGDRGGARFPCSGLIAG